MPLARLAGSEDGPFCGSAGLSILNLRFAASARTCPVPGWTAASSRALTSSSSVRSVICFRAAFCAFRSSEVTIR
jgi:hypothetical protein